MYDLKQLRAAATEACQQAIAARATMPNEAVNWADLKCNEAAFVTTDSGEGYYRVCIDEAAPESNKLREFIYSQLNSAGFFGIDIEIEW